MEFSQRKPNRLSCFNYNQNGYYHITICTKDKQRLLGKILPGDVFTPPTIQLSPWGLIAKKYIEGIPKVHNDILLDTYCIMPNHIHLLLGIQSESTSDTTRQNQKIPLLISAFKRLSAKEIGSGIWQRGYYDHIIRNEKDYLTTWQYIADNPAKWIYDDYYITD